MRKGNNGIKKKSGGGSSEDGNEVVHIPRVGGSSPPPHHPHRKVFTNTRERFRQQNVAGAFSGEIESTEKI